LAEYLLKLDDTARVHLLNVLEHYVEIASVHGEEAKTRSLFTCGLFDCLRNLQACSYAVYAESSNTIITGGAVYATLAEAAAEVEAIRAHSHGQVTVVAVDVASYDPASH
jgi:hypothetical protein